MTAVFSRSGHFVLTLFVLLSTPAQADETLSYDANGNVETRTLPGGTTTYGYDDLNRVNSESGPAKTQSLTYDANDNRLTDGSGTKTYSPNSDRLLTENGQSISLDAAGHVTQARGLNFTWNLAGQLKTVSQGGTLLATYTYDYRGRRTRKVKEGAGTLSYRTTLYVYDLYDRLVSELNGTGNPLRTYVWRDDIPVALIIHGSETVLYLETDHLNTPIAARNQAGTVVWKWESDAFGSTPANEDPDGDGISTTINLRFPGQYYDRESGLHYNWHRYYDPRGGRYISADPIGLAGGLNLYSYVGGNPMSYTDPTGQFAILIPALPALPAIGEALMTVGTYLVGGAAMAAILNTSGDSRSDPSKAEKPGICDVGPNDLCEQLALAEAKAGAGVPIMGSMADAPRLVAVYGPGPWIKMQHTHVCPDGRKLVIHYFSNGRGLNVELKFK